MKNSKIYIFAIGLIFALIMTAVGYLLFLKDAKKDLLHTRYKAKSIDLRSDLKNMIDAKQKAGLALALTLARQDDKLPRYVLKNKIPKNYYKSLITEYKKNTLYKNIWIQILNENGVSLYRSWSEKKGDNLALLRKDIVDVIQNKKNKLSISVGKFDMSLKAKVPLYFKGKFIGIVEVISHFNSIAKELQKKHVDSIVLADKKFKKQLKYPFTKTFIGDYYVANFNTKKELRDYLQRRGVENYFHDAFRVENGYLIVSSLIRDDKSVIGSYIMFQKLNSISSQNIDDLIFKWLLFGIIVMMFVLGVINIAIYFLLRKQKQYYKNIIDNSRNIIIINDGKTILDVNKTFFQYFNKYENLDGFKKEHERICDFFIKENGYLGKEIDGLNWLEYILQNPKKSHKAKMIISEKVYYFLISVSIISVEKGHYSIILSDITEEENYKKRLEQITITDPLTGVYNRRYFHTKIAHEMYNADRYNHPLSLIMYDIDFFKKVNDTYGHGTGDEVLKEYANFIKSLLRGSDSLCRIGGEEFMIILPYIGINEAKKVAEKLRSAVENYKKIVPVTMSFGVTEYIKGESEDSLFKRVDDALYKAKESGRNRVVVG